LTPFGSPYDHDGNPLTDALWSYTWDAENRLIAMESTSAAIAGSITKQKLEFAYDYLHRRVQKKTFTWSGSAWTLATHRKFLYEGWNVIREDELLTAKVKTLAWGLDLVGSLSQSGGVGALLALHDTATNEAYLPGYDGNGNVAVMVDVATGTLKATYEYSPFGQFLRKEGSYAEANPIRFSTKYTDEETDLVYYGRRYYDPMDGRFVGRDPIEEQGGINLYAFVANGSVNRWDYLGLSSLEIYGEKAFRGDDNQTDSITMDAFLVTAGVYTMDAFVVYGNKDTAEDSFMEMRQNNLINDLAAALDEAGLDLSPGSLMDAAVGGGISGPIVSENAPNNAEHSDCAGLRSSRDTLKSQLDAGRVAFTRANNNYTATVNGAVVGSTLDQVGTLVANYNSGSVGMDVIGTAASEMHLPNIGRAVGGFSSGFSSVTLGVGFGLGALDIADGNYMSGFSQVYGSSVGTGALFGSMLARDGVISASADNLARTVGIGAVVVQTAIFSVQETYAAGSHIRDLNNQKGTIDQIQGRLDQQVSDLGGIYNQLEAKGCK